MGAGDGISEGGWEPVALPTSPSEAMKKARRAKPPVTEIL
jgi:hypothetical protein